MGKTLKLNIHVLFLDDSSSKTDHHVLIICLYDPYNRAILDMDSFDDTSEAGRDVPSSLLSVEDEGNSQSQLQSQLTKGNEAMGGQLPDDYLSCCDILSLGQRVTCTFEKPVDDLGFIDPTSDNKDVTSGTKLELPLWLARVLFSRGVVSIEVPKGYNETYREILDADATVVDLHTLGPNFYQFGKHLVDMKLKGSREMARSLVTTFHQRFHRLLDFSLSGTNDTQLEMIEYQTLLDDVEIDVLKTGLKYNHDFKKWENRSCEKLTANDMVSVLKKKKNAALQDMNVIHVHPPDADPS